MPATTPPFPVRWTRTMLDALPDDGQRHEIIDGVHHVTPSPALPHQHVLGDLYHSLRAYLQAEAVGWVYFAPCDIELADDTVVQPDLVVLRRSGERPPRSWKEAGRPILAIEVTSPSSMSRDHIIKRPRYQRAGIAEYWIVNPLARLVERWRPDDERPEIVTDTLRWLPDGASAGLVIELRPLFARVLDEEA